MRITLAQIVVAMTPQNHRRAHARRILTIPSNQIVEPLGEAQMARNEAVPHASHASLTPHLLSGTCTPTGRLPRTRNARRLHAEPWIYPLPIQFFALLGICEL